jgi:hypothetical protein
MPALRGFEVLSIGCCQSSWHAMPALRGFELDWALQFAVVPMPSTASNSRHFLACLSGSCFRFPSDAKIEVFGRWEKQMDLFLYDLETVICALTCRFRRWISEYCKTTIGHCNPTLCPSSIFYCLPFCLFSSVLPMSVVFFAHTKTRERGSQPIENTTGTLEYSRSTGASS